MTLYDPLRKIGWTEERIQRWLATPLPILCDLAPREFDAFTLSKLIRLVVYTAPTKESASPMMNYRMRHLPPRDHQIGVTFTCTLCAAPDCQLADDDCNGAVAQPVSLETTSHTKEWRSRILVARALRRLAVLLEETAIDAIALRNAQALNLTTLGVQTRAGREAVEALSHLDQVYKNTWTRIFDLVKHAIVG